MKKRLRLRVLRADHEPSMSQAVVAKLADMSMSRYWQIENGVGPVPSDDERKAVAAALGVKVGDIEWPELGVKAS